MLGSIVSLFRKIIGKDKQKNVKPAPGKIEKKSFVKSSKPVRSNKKITTTPVKKEEEAPKPKRWEVKDFKVPKEEGKVRFHDLRLSRSLMHAIADLDFKYCTPIQAQILSKTLAGKDAIGQAQTGTGKTAAFLVSAFNIILKKRLEEKRSKGSPRVLILAPTRELVVQIADDANKLAKYTNLKIQTIIGGMHYQKQLNTLKNNYIDVLVATPGRLLDFQRQKAVHLNKVEILILDEADRMLDMGFMKDVRTIVRSTPFKDKRQTLFFSATMSDDIKRIADSWTNEPEFVSVQPDQVEVDSVTQYLYLVSNDEKFNLLFNLFNEKNIDKAIIFCNRKDEANRLVKKLFTRGISCVLMTGDLDQKKRFKTLDSIKNGDFRVLIATDVAGRGIHIDGVSHVVNYSLPQNPEDYVHRIGRTGRAGATGISISFASEDDSFQIPNIEEYLGHKLECSHPDEELLKDAPAPTVEFKEEKKEQKSHNGNRPPRKKYNNNDRRRPRRKPPVNGEKSSKPKENGAKKD